MAQIPEIDLSRMARSGAASYLLSLADLLEDFVLDCRQRADNLLDENAGQRG